MYIFTTSDEVEILPIFLTEYIDPNTQEKTFGTLTLDDLSNSQYLNLSSDKNLGTNENNILNYVFGNNDDATNTGFTLIDNTIDNTIDDTIDNTIGNSGYQYSLKSNNNIDQ